MISGIPLQRGFDDFRAVDTRQPQIGDEDVEREVRETQQRLLTAVRLFDDEAVIGQALRDGLAQRMLVVDDQQMFLAFSHLVRVGGILTPGAEPVNSVNDIGPIAAASRVPIHLNVRRAVTPYGPVVVGPT